MIHLLNLLAAIALLVWSTHLVRTGMLRVAGENLRSILGKSFSNRLTAVAAGWGVTSLVQSATATCLIVASFVGKGLVAAGPALAVMLGADVGSAMMAVVFSFDLSWLSPLLIFAGVVMFTTRQDTSVGRVGRVLIGLGLITLALQLIVEATTPLTQSPAVRTLLASLPNEVLLDIVVGATLTVLSYSSLAIVLLTATLAASGIVPVNVALGLVLGANLGSGFLALLATGGASPQVRRLPLGNLIFKGLGAALAIPLLPQAHVWLQLSGGAVHEQVVWFHLGFNLLLALLFISFTGVVGRIVERVLPEPRLGALQAFIRPHDADIIPHAAADLVPIVGHHDHLIGVVRLAGLPVGNLQIVDWVGQASHTAGRSFGADQCFQKGIARQPIRAMQTCASDFAYREQSRDLRFPIYVGHHAATLIMGCWHYRNRLFGDINPVAETGFVNVGETLDHEPR